MDTEEFVQFIKRSTQHQFLYHFTDEANLDSIKSHGILSTDERKSKGIKPNACGGNDISRYADDKNKITDFVSLSFTDSHPLCFLAQEAGRLFNPKYLKICPEILLSDGVMFTDGVANSNDAPPMSIASAVKEKKIDYEIIYEHADRSAPKTNERLQHARKTEILVPECVPPEMIRW